MCDFKKSKTTIMDGPANGNFGTKIIKVINEFMEFEEGEKWLKDNGYVEDRHCCEMINRRNKCNCKHAKADVQKKSPTMNIVCTKKGKTTDPVYCELCKEREQ
jgi:hypothetical protein